MLILRVVVPLRHPVYQALHEALRHACLCSVDLRILLRLLLGLLVLVLLLDARVLLGFRALVTQIRVLLLVRCLLSASLVELDVVRAHLVLLSLI